MSYFFAGVSQFTNKLGAVTSKIANKLPFSKKHEEDIVDDFVVVPRHKYTKDDLSELSNKLSGIQQELRNMPDIDIKAMRQIFN